VRPFRFGYQTLTSFEDDLRAQAREAEDAGFDVFHTADHIGPGWAPLIALMAVADCTNTLRVCPLVLNNDFHHPVHLARELATLDQLSGGRVELGIGAGHAFTEYASIGQGFDLPAVRKERMAESTEVIRRLLDGESVSYEGEHYQLNGVQTLRSLQEHLPILVGVHGRRALAHAARHADIIGLTMVGKTLEDGQHHAVRWAPEQLDDAVAYIRDQSTGRSRALELHALVQAVVVTNDRAAATRGISDTVSGLSVEDATTTPFLAIGSHDEIAEHLVACRERWGISYYSVRDIEGFAPVIERLRRFDARS
jgi:probable F420-dependent oxidoreductase